MSTQPNVIFILSDQHSLKAMSGNSHFPAITPNFDRMKAAGVSFTNAITQNPVCTPSRVSWLSGQYCHNHGYYGLDGPHPGPMPTIMGHFRKFGYKTAAIGKIHCPEYWVEDDCDYFLEARGLSIGGSPEFDAHLKALGYDCDPDNIYKHQLTGQSHDGKPSVLSYKDSQEKFIVDRAQEFITEAKAKSKPFIAHVSFGKPHQPYMPAPEFWEMYNDVGLNLPPNFDYDMQQAKKAPHLIKKNAIYKNNQWTHFQPHEYKAGAMRKLQGYLGCVTQVDHAVGELLDWLKTQNLDKDTIVIYSTDHGDHMCEHGVMEKAPGICSDSITRIPLLFQWPEHFKPGLQQDNLVETVDLSQTLCNLCNIEQMETSDGKDISPLLFGSNEPIRDFAVTEFSLSKSIRKRNFRYIHYTKDFFAKDYPNGFGELYDIEADPWEMKNLYFEDDYKHIVTELKEDLLDWLLTSTRLKTNNTLLPLKDPSQYTTRYHKPTAADGKVSPDYVPRGDFYS